MWDDYPVLKYICFDQWPNSVTETYDYNTLGYHGCLYSNASVRLYTFWTYWLVIFVHHPFLKFQSIISKGIRKLASWTLDLNFCLYK